MDAGSCGLAWPALGPADASLPRPFFLSPKLNLIVVELNQY